MSTTPEFHRSVGSDTNPTQVLPGPQAVADPADTSAAWGEPSNRSTKGWTLKRGIAAAGIALLVAGGGGAAIYAATNASSSSQAQGGPGGGQGMGGGGQGMPGQGMPGQGMAGAMSAGLGDSVRGEYVVEQNGSYVTKLTQTGEVTAVSSTSITVKSSDGVSQSYQVSDSTTVGSLSSAQQGGPPAAGQGSGQQGGSSQNGNAQNGNTQNGGSGDGGASGNNNASSGSMADIATGDNVRVIALKESSGNSAESISKVAS